jgi:TatD DNase family protein
MTDAHCHVSCGDQSVRELLIGRDFFGVHPWETLSDPALTLTSPNSTLIDSNFQEILAALRSKLLANPKAGVGEIGLDRLKVRDIPPIMREVFEAQLALAIELGRPVVLHGAKCWGQVVSAVKRARTSGPGVAPASLSTADCRLPTFLFHGFSRSDGLIPDIVALGGFISVGPAVLNDHAVNYRELVKKIPLDRLLVETDAVVGARVPTRPHIRDVLAKTAEIIGVSAGELEKVTDENAEKFFGASL